MKIKIDSSTALRVGSTVIGIAGLLIGNLVSKNDRAEMKAELKEEILKDLTSQKDN